ncbi:glycerophosphodiester phosphodiesterase family protein [Fretibacter rubidus]|uniref:glycerophosphodiester phosphodiesterase family protein n=1 Tax=Fretibacter rubidus TaxID=570162 RepID=UPI00352ACE57
MSYRKIALLSAFLPLFMGCQVEQTKKSEAPAQSLPPLSTFFACLPSDSAVIAAHRATSKDMNMAENALPSIKALYEGGIMMVEMDVAGLKEGVHILFHDGVWEEDTTGTGAVAASTWDEASTYLLRDNQGKLTSMVPGRLDEVLEFAKGRLYLELDFKSSAKYETVIDAVRAADMAEHVILIAYTADQAQKLASLAPEMMISASIRENDDVADLIARGVKRENIAGWVGTVSDDLAIETMLNSKGFPVLAMGRRDLPKYAKTASVVVSSYALSDKAEGDYPGIIGLTPQSQAAYESCLAHKTDG